MTCLLLVLTFSVHVARAQSAPGGTVRGTVRDANGSLVIGVAISLRREGETQNLTTKSDAQGAYRFSGLRDGAYMVRAVRAGENPAGFDFSLAANEVKNIDLTLESAKASDASAALIPASNAPQFFDEPKFTVAGVTDASNPGGHGSSSSRRTTESLTRETVSLGAQPSTSTAGAINQTSQQSAPSNSSDINAVIADLCAGKYESARTRADALLSKPLPVQEQAELYNVLGRADENLGRPLDAAQEYERAAELDPSEPNIFDWGAELLLHRAFQPATDVFAKGTRLFPRSVRMLSALGVAHYARGSYQDAFEALCQASDLDPNDAQPYLFLGKMQNVETTQPPCALASLARFARLQPQNPLANYYYAMSLPKRSQNADQVESLLKKAARLDPRFGEVYLQLGNLDFERRDFDATIADYQKAIEVSPELSEAHYRLARLYQSAGERSKAQQEMEIYQRLSKLQKAEDDRQRSEIKEFVYRAQQKP